jgi:hypothetical protein
MKQPTDERQKTPIPRDPGKTLPPTRDVPSKEPSEVLGRHKNTGQKDHKGAR